MVAISTAHQLDIYIVIMLSAVVYLFIVIFYYKYLVKKLSPCVTI